MVTLDPNTIAGVMLAICVGGPVLLFLVARGRWSRRLFESAVLILVGVALTAYGPLIAVATVNAERRTVVVEVEESRILHGRGASLSTYARFRGEGLDGTELNIPTEAGWRLRKGELVRITYTPATREVWDLQILRRVTVKGATIDLDVAGERFPAAPALSSPFVSSAPFTALGIAAMIGGLLRFPRAARPRAP